MLNNFSSNQIMTVCSMQCGVHCTIHAISEYWNWWRTIDSIMCENGHYKFSYSAALRKIVNLFCVQYNLILFLTALHPSPTIDVATFNITVLVDAPKLTDCKFQYKFKYLNRIMYLHSWFSRLTQNCLVWWWCHREVYQFRHVFFRSF